MHHISLIITSPIIQFTSDRIPSKPRATSATLSACCEWVLEGDPRPTLCQNSHTISGYKFANVLCKIACQLMRKSCASGSSSLTIITRITIRPPPWYGHAHDHLHRIHHEHDHATTIAVTIIAQHHHHYNHHHHCLEHQHTNQHCYLGSDNPKCFSKAPPPCSTTLLVDTLYHSLQSFTKMEINYWSTLVDSFLKPDIWSLDATSSKTLFWWSISWWAVDVHSCSGYQVLVMETSSWMRVMVVVMVMVIVIAWWWLLWSW